MIPTSCAPAITSSICIPGAGEQGGRIVFEGPYSKLLDGSTNTLTSRYLRRDLKTWHSTTRRTPHPKRMVRFLGAQANNLKGIDVSIPLDLLDLYSTFPATPGKSTVKFPLMIYESLVKRMNRETAARRRGRMGLSPHRKSHVP